MIFLIKKTIKNSVPNKKCLNCKMYENCGGGCVCQWTNYSFSDLMKLKWKKQVQWGIALVFLCRELFCFILCFHMSCKGKIRVKSKLSSHIRPRILLRFHIRSMTRAKVRWLMCSSRIRIHFRPFRRIR